MGCCVSSNKPTPPPKTGISHTKITTKHGVVSKSPPHSNPLLEEEAVKQVLTETPTVPKPLSPPILKSQAKNTTPFIKSAPLLQDKEHQNGVSNKKPFTAFAADDASEICSTHSESVSASTSVTEKRVHNGVRKDEFRQRSPERLKNRQFSSEMHREKTVGRSPLRRSEPSPGRARPVAAPGYGRRRENGQAQGSCRRSTSPAMRADSDLGRAQSTRKTGKSPGRVGAGSGNKIRMLDEGNDESGDSKWAAINASSESIENPLVSLECFIFL